MVRLASALSVAAAAAASGAAISGDDAPEAAGGVIAGAGTTVLRAPVLRSTRWGWLSGAGAGRAAALAGSSCIFSTMTFSEGLVSTGFSAFSTVFSGIFGAGTPKIVLVALWLLALWVAPDATVAAGRGAGADDGGVAGAAGAAAWAAGAAAWRATAAAASAALSPATSSAGIPKMVRVACVAETGARAGARRRCRGAAGAGAAGRAVGGVAGGRAAAGVAGGFTGGATGAARARPRAGAGAALATLGTDSGIASFGMVSR